MSGPFGTCSRTYNRGGLQPLLSDFVAGCWGGQVNPCSAVRVLVFPGPQAGLVGHMVHSRPFRFESLHSLFNFCHDHLRLGLSGAAGGFLDDVPRLTRCILHMHVPPQFRDWLGFVVGYQLTASGFPIQLDSKTFTRLACVCCFRVLVGSYLSLTGLAGLGFQLVRVSASQESGSLPARQVWVSGELAKVPFGSIAGLDLAGSQIWDSHSAVPRPSTSVCAQLGCSLVAESS